LLIFKNFNKLKNPPATKPMVDRDGVIEKFVHLVNIGTKIPCTLTFTASKALI